MRATTPRLMICLLFAVATQAASADKAESKKLFKTAYAAYQTCIESADNACAAEQAKQAYEAGLGVFKPDGKNVAALTYNYALAMMNDRCHLCETRDHPYRLMQQALPLYEKLYGEKSVELLALLVDLTKAQVDVNKSEKQKNPYWKQAEQLSEQINGEDSLAHATVLMYLTNTMVIGDSYSFAATKKRLAKAYDIFLRELGETHPYTGVIAFNLGKYKLGARRLKESEKYFTQALKAFETEDSYRNRYAMSAHGFLVETYEEMGEREKATQHCLAIGQAQPSVPSEDYYPLFKRPPKYPSSAAVSGTEGYVTVEFTVDTSGFAKDVSVVEWEGSRSFIEPSIEAAEGFRYAPQFVDGKPVDVPHVRNRFTFRIAK